MNFGVVALREEVSCCRRPGRWRCHEKEISISEERRRKVGKAIEVVLWKLLRGWTTNLTKMMKVKGFSVVC